MKNVFVHHSTPENPYSYRGRPDGQTDGVGIAGRAGHSLSVFLLCLLGSFCCGQSTIFLTQQAVVPWHFCFLALYSRVERATKIAPGKLEL